MTEISGYCDPQFEPVRALMAQKIETGAELGASLYVNINGQEVLDLWGGWQEKDRQTPWNAQTLVNVFSGTKTVASLALLMMVERGQLDLDAPVAKYWPEFAQKGKGNVLVRHVMSHTAGVPAWEPPFSFEDAITRAATDRLAAQEGWWEPGSRASYHASSFGHLVSEIALRASGRPLRDFIHTEIAGPLEAPFILGLEDGQFDNIATIYPADDPAPAPAPKIGQDREPSIEEKISLRTRLGSFSGTLGDPLTVFNSEAWRRTDFAGSSGHANARGLGRCLSALANGGTARGHKLLSQPVIDQIFREQSGGVDAYYARPIRWGIGYALAPLETKEKGPLPFIRPGPRTCYWYGTGGSMGIVDVERGITIAYAMNQCQSGRGSPNGAYYDAILDAI